ncbi:hypothetical protein TNCV_3565061 [Trichonephila clavipes]|nr:hypothetical protein TNCV_3565061 [Trichonephila clavipes]
MEKEATFSEIKPSLCCKRFSVGRESTEDDQRPGCLVTVSGVETVTKINQIVRADRRMSIRMIVEALNADKETDCHGWLGCSPIWTSNFIFDDFFQLLWPYIGNNTANVVFQMVKRLWLIRIDQ